MSKKFRFGTAAYFLAAFAVFIGASAYYGETIGFRYPNAPRPERKAMLALVAFVILYMVFSWLLDRVARWRAQRRGPPREEPPRERRW